MRYLIFISLISFCWLSSPAQSVAINEDGSAPAPSAMLDVKSTNRGFLPPRHSATQRSLLFQPASGLLVFDSTNDHLYHYVGGTGWRRFVHSGYWLEGNSTLYRLSGNVGIGTSAPQERLHLQGGNFRQSNGDLALRFTSGKEQKLLFDYTGGSPNGFTQGIDFRINAKQSAFINFIASTSGQDALRLFPSALGQNGMTIFENGEFRWNALGGPTLQWQQGDVNKIFAQVSGNDLRIGTNAGNSAGRVVMATQGTNRVFITSAGRVGINQETPAEVLDVNGNTVVTGTLDVNAKTSAANLEFSGKLTKPSVGNASLTPLCYGSVYADGAPRSITPNVTVTRTSMGTYKIVCAGLDESCMILVTAADERHLGNGFTTEPGIAYIRITYDSSTAPPPSRDSDFCFLIFKK